MLGTRDYVEKNGFADVLVGAVRRRRLVARRRHRRRRLGPARVHGVLMPSRYSSEGSVDDAVAAGRESRHRHPRRSTIEPAHEALLDMLEPGARRTATAGLAGENLQARIRGVALHGALERVRLARAHDGQQERDGRRLRHAVRGHGGGFAVIKDVPKTLVYELCEYRNARRHRPASRAPSSTSPPRPSCARTSATTTACRRTRFSTRSSRATSSWTCTVVGAGRGGFRRRDGAQGRSSSSTAPSTSGARRRPGRG